MDDLHWQRLQQLFGDALQQPAAERAAFLDRACAGDAALRAEVERMLQQDLRSDAAVTQAIAQTAAQLVAGQTSARVGQRLGPWRITAHLADGGMGAVYRAERDDGHYAQQVAVKLLNPTQVSDEAKARLETERRILARLTHPHIAALLDGGSSADGVPYLVMEFVDGEPIDAWCDHHALSTPQRLRLVVQVCRAVDHAHRNLVVHRDLKPGNILVDAQGAPRLLDFGIAKLMDGAADATRAGEQPFTPSHASPEQITGGPVTTATDVYALGVLLYGLLSGRSPYGDEQTSPVELARRIVETPPRRPSAAAAVGGSRRPARELEGDLDNIVLMALRKEPERRYASAGALADDIERHLTHLPVAARADTLAYRAALFLRRHPVAVPVSALALLAALAATVGFTWRLADERDRALAAEARARRVAAFSASVLERTGATEDAAREVSVPALLERAAQRVASELRTEPEVATRMRLALGAALHSWGSYDAALVQLQASLAEAETRGAGGERDAAEALRLMGTVTHDQGRLEDSLLHTRRAESLLRRVGPPAEHAALLGDVALSLNALRRRDEAEPVFREAIASLRRIHGGDHEDIAWLLNNLAWGVHAMGRLDEALPLYEEALAMQQRLGAAVVEIAQTRHNLAGVYYDRGELDTAERLWSDTLARFEQVFGADGHASVARGQAMLALVAADRGDWTEALRLSERALDTNLKLLGERHRWTATTLVRRGESLLGAGRLDEAERLLRRAEALQRELEPGAHAAHVGPQLALARLALARGAADAAADAERHARRAFDVIGALPSPDRVPRDAVELTLARAIALQGRRDEARQLLDTALARMRRQLPAAHWRRVSAEAVAGLPPFAAMPDPAATAAAEAALQRLRPLLRDSADAVREIEAGLGRSTAPG